MWFLVFLILMIAAMALWMWKRQYPVVRDQANALQQDLLLEGIEAQLHLAKQLIEKNTPEAAQRAYQLCEDLAKKYDYPDAYILMAQMYLQGQGREADLTAGMALLEKAYQNGSDEAAYQLAQIYQNKNYSIHDEAQAQYWLQHAIARGNLDAQHQMAQQYTQQNQVDKAEQVLQQAAENGHAASQYEWAMHLRQQSEPDLFQIRHWLTQASAQNYVPAMEQLTQLCAQHQADPSYRQQAFALLKQRAEQGDVEANYGYQLAVIKQVYDTDQLIEVMGRVKNQAQQKDRFAQTLLGTAYYHGWGIGQNQQMAFRYWSQAAHSDEPMALCHIANLYLQGELVEQDQAKAFELFQYADQIKSTDFSQLSLALCYLYGHGVAQDTAKAMPLLQSILKQHFALNVQSKADLFYGLGLFYNLPTMPLADANTAQKYLKLAIQEGHSDAMYALAQCYLEPAVGFVEDAEQAAQWLQQAAGHGHLIAMHQLGNLYLIGRGVAKDEQQALLWLQRAAEQNHAAAITDLAEMYEHGLGVEADPEQALALYQQAANLADPEACYQLGRLYLDERLFKRDYVQARAWLAKARSLGLAKADVLYQTIVHH